MDNEITLKIKCNTMDKFCRLLENKGFKPIKKFLLYDIYFVPNNLNFNLSIREILAKAVLLREIEEFESYKSKKYKLTFKDKEILEDGTVLSQKNYSVNIEDKNDGKNFIEAIGYKELMRIKDYNIVYEKDGFQIATKDIENGENLVEVEIVPDDERYNTIEKLKEALIKFDLPLYMDNFFVKKAEIELEKVLKR